MNPMAANPALNAKDGFAMTEADDAILAGHPTQLAGHSLIDAAGHRQLGADRGHGRAEQHLDLPDRGGYPSRWHRAASGTEWRGVHGSLILYSCNSLTDDTEVRRAVCLRHRPEIQALRRRIDADLSRRGFVVGMAASIASLGLPFRVRAQ